MTAITLWLFISITLYRVLLMIEHFLQHAYEQ